MPLWNCEHGLAAIPRKAFAAFEELNVNVAALTDQQRQWLTERAAARRQAILAKVGAAR